MTPIPTQQIGQALAGRLAVITGGTRGIGRAIADRFIAEGADVVVTARSEASGRDILAAYPGRVTFVAADAARVADLENLAAVVAGLGRPVDTVVANAGGGDAAFVTTSTEAEFDAVMDINVKSAFFTVQKLLPYMRDGATVVLVGSIAGFRGSLGQAVYGPAKAAVRCLARSMTSELAPRGIRVNCLSPGPTQTEGFDRFIDGDEAKLKGVLDTIMVDHVGQPAETAAAALFLATEASSYIAGTELVVDGGVSQV